MRGDYSFFRIEVRDRIAFITTDGEGLNAAHLVGSVETARLAADIAADDEVNVALITGGAGPVGANPNGSGDGNELGIFAGHDLAYSFVQSLVELDKPIVVAQSSDASAITATTAFLADVLVAERQVRFRDLHVSPLGVVSATGPLIWPLSMGLMRAKRYILTGDWFTAEEAERMGLVSEVVDTGESLGRATEYARRLAASRPEAIRYTKRALNEQLRAGLSPVFSPALALEFLTGLHRSGDSISPVEPASL